MGVLLSNKKSSENFYELIENMESFNSLCNELNIKPNKTNDEIVRSEMEDLIYIETIGKNSLSLRYSEWCNFLKKYVWSFFDKKGISTKDFNSDDVGTINSKNMKILIEYLKSNNISGERNNEIKEFLLNQEEGITYS